MTPFPNWLPKPIADHVRKQLIGGGLDTESKERLTRLCVDAGMKNAWQALQRAAPDEAVLTEFLDFVLRGPRFLPNPRKPSPSPATLRQSFEKIAKHAASLILELQQLSGEENTPDSGIEELRSALLRIAQSPRPQAGAEGKLSVKKTTTAITLYEFLCGDPDQPSPTEYLYCLNQAASLASKAPPPPGPRKLAATNAARTQYIREVDNFILARIGRSMPSIVATTINVSLDLHEQPVTEALVRNLRVTGTKLKSTKRKISAKHRR